MSMNAQEKGARQRVRVLQLAETLGTVSAACRPFTTVIRRPRRRRRSHAWWR